MSKISVSPISVGFDPKAPKILDNITFDFSLGEITTILGPSGVGKTTFLKALESQLKEQYKIQFLSQSSKLYEQKNYQSLKLVDYVFENNEVIKSDKERCISLIRELSDLFHLEYTDKRLVSSLSGGELKRVDIFKSIINSPDILLLDEPFNSLDPLLMTEVEEFLKTLSRQKTMAIIITSHFANEALRFSDRVAVIEKGKIPQIGSPTDIYFKPKNKLISNYFGPSNLMTCEFNNNYIFTPFGKVERKSRYAKAFGSFDLKPEFFSINKEGEFKGKIIDQIFLGSKTLLKTNYQNKNYYIAGIKQNSDSIRFNVDLNGLTQTEDILTELQ